MWQMTTIERQQTEAAEWQNGRGGRRLTGDSGEATFTVSLSLPLSLSQHEKLTTPLTVYGK